MIDKLFLVTVPQRGIIYFFTKPFFLILVETIIIYYVISLSEVRSSLVGLPDFKSGVGR